MENNHQKVPQDPFLFLLTTINYSSADPQKKLLKKKELRKIKKKLNIETPFGNLIKNKKQEWFESTF